MSKELEALRKLGDSLASADTSKTIEEVYYHIFFDIKNALNELERLRKFKANFDAYELAKKQDFVAYEIWQECEETLTYATEKLERIRILIDPTKFKTTDIELLRDSIREVLDDVPK